MKVPFERVLDGTIKYVDTEIIGGMNEWQELIARIAIGRVAENAESVKNTIINNGIVRTFGIIDADGMVDVDTLVVDIKREISRKEKLTVKIPMFGAITFKPEDVDTIHRYINGG